MGEVINIDIDSPRLAYSVEEVLRLVPFGRNKLYDEGKAGRLKLRKLGASTLILADDLRDFLQSLPLMYSAAETQ